MRIQNVFKKRASIGSITLEIMGSVEVKLKKRKNRNKNPATKTERNVVINIIEPYPTGV